MLIAVSGRIFFIFGCVSFWFCLLRNVCWMYRNYTICSSLCCCAFLCILFCLCGSMMYSYLCLLMFVSLLFVSVCCVGCYVVYCVCIDVWFSETRVADVHVVFVLVFMLVCLWCFFYFFSFFRLFVVVFVFVFSFFFILFECILFDLYMFCLSSCVFEIFQNVQMC